jgi:oligopeptide transport system ATP-binding protein
MKDPILRAVDVTIEFSLRGRTLRAVRSASLEAAPGETLAIVGESGSGKSVLVKSFLGMLDKNGKVVSGRIEYGGMDLAGLKDERDWLAIRGGRIGMVFQDPMTALDPLMRVGDQVRESIELHRGLRGAAAAQAAVEMLDRVGIPEPERRARQYPHQFSGGMRQRAVIAAAVAAGPEILICDEPTTALDVTIQAQVLSLVKSLQRELGMSVIFITHDLGVVAKVADKVAVMYSGEVVETGTVDDVFYEPAHPYTWSLLASLPQLGVKGERLFSITGSPPSPFEDIKGDAFAPRNPHALKVDFMEPPPWFDVSPTHRVKSWLAHEWAPKVNPPPAVQRLEERVRTLSKEADSHGRGRTSR